MEGYSGPLEEGDDLTLSCSTVYELPNTEISWRVITLNETKTIANPTLSVTNVRAGDSGVYICIGSTDTQYVETKIRVNVTSIIENEKSSDNDKGKSSSWSENNRSALIGTIVVVIILVNVIAVGVWFSRVHKQNHHKRAVYEGEYTMGSLTFVNQYGSS